MTSRFAFACVLLLSLFSFMACKSAPAIPGWVKNGQTPETYKPALYMTGIGQATTLEAAKDNARAEIAKQFSVQIEQMLQVMEKYAGMETERGYSFLNQTDITELTRVSVNETIQGIEIGETYSAENGTVWALAVLRRSPAMRRLTLAVTDLDDEINARVKRSESANSILAKIRPLVQSLELMKERAIKNRQLMVVNYVGEGIEPDISPAELSAMLSELLGELKVAVEIEGEAAERVRDAIVQSLTNGNISVQPESEGAHLIIRGATQIKQTNKANKTGFTFAKISVHLSMINTEDGSTFGKVDHVMRDGALSWEDAKDKTLMNLLKKIVALFNEKLHGFLSA